MRKPRFPEGWDESRVAELIAHYEGQSDEEAVAEDEAAISAKMAREDPSPDDDAEGPGALIRSWLGEEDADEQRETLESLVRALDEDRLSDRKLFPEELKGKSW